VKSETVIGKTRYVTVQESLMYLLHTINKLNNTCECGAR